MGQSRVRWNTIASPRETGTGIALTLNIIATHVPIMACSTRYATARKAIIELTFTTKNT